MTPQRLIRYAADNGFDAISIPKAQCSSKRYRDGLTRRIQVDPFDLDR